MCPITIAGALAQQNAEALGVIALSQIVNPGAPMVYGGFYFECGICVAVLLPSVPPNIPVLPGLVDNWRVATVCRFDLRIPMPPIVSMHKLPGNRRCHLWGAVMGHAQIIKHAAGWLEGGLCASFEKFIIDVDMLQMMRETLKPLQVDESTLALEAIREAGHGGHFLRYRAYPGQLYHRVL